MKPIETQLDGVLLFKTEIFEDFRGKYVEIYNADNYNFILPIEFVQDDVSISSKHVLRGIHGDGVTWKLVTCLSGKFYLVVVDCRQYLPTFGKWQAFSLSDSNFHQVLIPPGYGNGHLALSDQVVFHYKQSTYYDRSRQFTYKWDDPKFNIWWPVANPILSERDSGVQ